MHCRIFGMLSMGNIIPLSSMHGSISIIAEASSATSCLRAIVLMSMPSDSATVMYIPDTANIQPRLPAMGTSRTKCDMPRMKHSMQKASTR